MERHQRGDGNQKEEHKRLDRLKLPVKAAFAGR
jgi:hypothetical protein